MATKPFSIEEALRYGWNTTKANLKPLVLLALVSFFLSMLQSNLQGSAALLGLVVQVIQVAVMMLWIRTALRLYAGEKPDFSNLPAQLGDFFGFLLTAVLFGLLVAAGFVLLIVPGIYWGVRYMFCTFLVVDRKLDPVESFKASRRLTDGRKWDLFVFALALLGINILGAIALGVGLLVTIPVSYLAMAFVYRKLEAAVPQAQLAPGQPGAPGVRPQPV